MKQKTKIIIAGITGAIALGGIAVAAQGYNDHRKMKRFFSPERIMETVDTNGDLAASREELNTFAGSYFRLADADEDQRVTKAEIVSALEASVLPEKVKRRSGRVADRIVGQADIDQDGALTLAELENRITKFHALADWNDDNAVELAEIKRLRGGFGHKGKKRQ